VPAFLDVVGPRSSAERALASKGRGRGDERLDPGDPPPPLAVPGVGGGL